MGRLILPGEAQRPRDGLTLLVPRGYEDAAPARIVGVCNLCGERFDRAGQEQEWQEHVGVCAKQQMDRIQAEVEKRRESIFHEDQWDPEASEHLREGAGKRMREAVDRLGVDRAVRDGHLEVRPNERAG